MKVEFVVSHGVAFRERLLGINVPLCWPRPCVALGAYVRACVCVARTQVQVVYVGVV